MFLRDMKFSNIAVVVICLVLQSCLGSGSSKDDVEIPKVSTTSTNLSYHSDTKPIFDLYCASCHTGDGVAPFPLENYTEVFAHRSPIHFALESGTMPPEGYSKPSAAEIALVNDWIEAGAPEGDGTEINDSKKLATNFTYQADIKSIIDAKCATCHETGGFAPFPLTNYQEVYAVRAASAHQIENNSMPPWLPTKGFTPFQYDRSLTREERYKILNWIAGGAPEGSATVTTQSTTTIVNNSIRADVSITMPEAYTPQVLPDDYRCFVLDWNQTEAVYLTGMDVTPGVKAQVHHVIVSVIEPDDVEVYTKASGADGKPGFQCVGGSNVAGGKHYPRQIGGWVPGFSSGSTPEGTGIRIEPGSKIVMQMHYNTLVVQPQPDQTTAILQIDSQVEREALSFLMLHPSWLMAGGMPIPANDPSVTITHDFSAKILMQFLGSAIGVAADEPFSIHSTGLHMHTLGKSGSLVLQRENGTKQTLIEIEDWDFSWQDTYDFTSEVIVQPNDVFTLTCNWDNSAENQLIVDGVQQTPRYVEWGEGTWDEMCISMMYITKAPVNAAAFSYQPTVYIQEPHYLQQFKSGQIVPLSLSVNNFTLDEPTSEGDDHGHSNETDDHSKINTGYYRISLDGAATNIVEYWESDFFYPLPSAITDGTHNLKVELVAADGHVLGITDNVDIEVTSTDTASAYTPLIDVDAWVEQSSADDSLADHRPDPVSCPSNSWYDENGALEVQTGYCNYLSVSQPLLTDLKKWDQIHLVLWHSQLRFSEPADAHVAISIGNTIVWEQTVAIPANAEIYDLNFPVMFDVSQGTEIEFHLHNHGFNTWSLLSLELEN